MGYLQRGVDARHNHRLMHGLRRQTVYSPIGIFLPLRLSPIRWLVAFRADCARPVSSWAPCCTADAIMALPVLPSSFFRTA